MASKRDHLRSVDAPVAPAAPLKPTAEKAKTVTQAIGGTERDVLVTCRAKIATDIDKGVPAHTLAGLMRQLFELDSKIRALDLLAESEEAEGGDSNQGTAEDEAFDAASV